MAFQSIPEANYFNYQKRVQKTHCVQTLFNRTYYLTDVVLLLVTYLTIVLLFLGVSY